MHVREIRARLQQLEELGEERGTGMRWKMLDRAIRHASAGVDCNLYKGNLGVALLAEEIEHPAWAATPMSEVERWGH